MKKLLTNPSGRELDVLVYKRVGYDKRGLDFSDLDHSFIPMYSTKVEHALQLIDWLVKYNWSITRVNNKWKAGCSKGVIRKRVMGDTLMHAIALAILNFVEEEKE